MIITVECPDCHTTFPVDPRKVPDGGVKVRCSACSGIFFVEKPEIPAPATTPPVPVPASGGAEPDDGGGSRETGSDAEMAAPSRAEASGPAQASAVEEERENVDPWSGAGWDDPAEMGVPHPDPADPWSGGVGLHDDAGPEGEDASPMADEDDDTPTADWADAAPAADDEVEAVIEPAPADDWAGDDEATSDDWASEAGETPDDEPAFDDLPVAEPAADWVVEQSAPVTFEEPKAPVERLQTIEEETRAAAEAHDAGAGAAPDLGEWDEGAVPPAAEAPVEAPVEADAGSEPSPGAAAMAEAVEEEAHPQSEAVEEAVYGAQPEAPPEPEAAPVGFQFGKRDPHEKARRLARVLVSDMITYNPERHQRALEQGTLHADFEEEIRKSWAEYTDQVGRELAESTSYWFDALNEILARGEKVF